MTALSSLAVPVIGERVQLPGDLEAVASELEAPEVCEFCGLACGVRTIVYGVPIGGGFAFVHPACLGEVAR